MKTIAVYDAPEEYRNAQIKNTPTMSALSKQVALRLGLANSLAMPLHETSRAWILVGTTDLASITLTNRMTLTFASDSPVAVTKAWKNLVLAREPQVVIPSFVLGDALGATLVELADTRWLCDNQNYCIPINAQYNVSAPAYRGALAPDCYYSASLNSGDVWTWDEMAGAIWGVMATQLGSYPGLPFSPDGWPEGWVFQGISAWDALREVLLRLGCAITADLSLSANQFKIVQVGAADTAAAAVISAAESANRKVHDGEFRPLARLQPAGVRVFFNRQEQYYGSEKTIANDSTQWQTNSVYTVDVAGPSGGEPGIYHPIRDDLPAIYAPDGTLTNTSLLATRAAERAADYFRMKGTNGGDRQWKRYSGLLDMTTGSTLKGVRWVADNRGCWTEIVRHSQAMLGVDDNGEWIEAPESSIRLHAPDFRLTHPIYPGKEAVVAPTDGIDYLGTFKGLLQSPDNPNQTFDDSTTIYIIDLFNAPSLPIEQPYNGTLIGLRIGGPLYISLASGNTGNALTVTAKWALVNPTIADPAASPPIDGLTKLIWDNETAFSPATNQAVPWAGAWWFCLRPSKGVEPNAVNVLDWRLWTLTDLVPDPYSATYVQGTPIIGPDGNTYVVTNPGGASAPPPGPDYASVSGTSDTYDATIHTGYSSGDVTTYTDGNQYIVTSTGGTSQTPGGSGWLLLQSNPSFAVGWVDESAKKGAIETYGGLTWILQADKSFGPPGSPDWTAIPWPPTANGASYDSTATYGHGDFTREGVGPTYTVQSEPAVVSSPLSPIPPTWDCLDCFNGQIGSDGCVERVDGSGQYSSLARCLGSCVHKVTWNCDGHGNCTPVCGDGGTYLTYYDCITACNPPPPSPLPNITCVCAGSLDPPGSLCGMIVWPDDTVNFFDLPGLSGLQYDPSVANWPSARALLPTKFTLKLLYYDPVDNNNSASLYYAGLIVATDKSFSVYVSLFVWGCNRQVCSDGTSQSQGFLGGETWPAALTMGAGGYDADYPPILSTWADVHFTNIGPFLLTTLPGLAETYDFRYGLSVGVGWIRVPGGLGVVCDTSIFDPNADPTNQALAGAALIANSPTGDGKFFGAKVVLTAGGACGKCDTGQPFVLDDTGTPSVGPAGSLTGNTPFVCAVP